MNVVPASVAPFAGSYSIVREPRGVAALMGMARAVRHASCRLGSRVRQANPLDFSSCILSYAGWFARGICAGRRQIGGGLGIRGRALLLLLARPLQHQFQPTRSLLRQSTSLATWRYDAAIQAGI